MGLREGSGQNGQGNENLVSLDFQADTSGHLSHEKHLISAGKEGKCMKQVGRKEGSLSRKTGTPLRNGGGENHF